MPFPTAGDLPNPGIELSPLPLQVDSLPLSQPGSLKHLTLQNSLLTIILNCLPQDKLPIDPVLKELKCSLRETNFLQLAICDKNPGGHRG